MLFLTYFLENNNEKIDNNILLLLMICINKIKTEHGHYHK